MRLLCSCNCGYIFFVCNGSVGVFSRLIKTLVNGCRGDSGHVVIECGMCSSEKVHKIYELFGWTAIFPHWVWAEKETLLAVKVLTVYTFFSPCTCNRSFVLIHLFYFICFSFSHFVRSSSVAFAFLYFKMNLWFRYPKNKELHEPIFKKALQ